MKEKDQTVMEDMVEIVVHELPDWNVVGRTTERTLFDALWNIRFQFISDVWEETVRAEFNECGSTVVVDKDRGLVFRINNLEPPEVGEENVT